MRKVLYIQLHNHYLIRDVITCGVSIILFNSRTPWDLKHFGNPKNENLLRSQKFYRENEFLVKICRSQLITEILSFFCFHKNFMTNLSLQIVIQLSRVQHFWRYAWIWLTPYIVLSDGIHSLLGRFTDLTFSREENKNKVIRCGFFNLSNGIFWVLYEKFDWIILKIWSLLLFSQSVRELMGDWKEGSVNRRRREWIPSDNTLLTEQYGK